ncbi:FCS-Like Zinc finger 2-like [Phragmites australis]|uniref:FCS-Like Zinc finger 2-like n=1 Tax=Phragmites australis TaxID=29695 RepID=UPI002D7686CD|nr:FCS-Like Zinc finger 2-like [Phragmites australis]
MEDYYYFPASLETTGYVEAGFPGHTASRNPSSPSPRPRDDGASELRHHYLNACFRCGRLLAGNRDIFMYRGDTPFCTEECRQQQIEADEAREKRSKQPAAATGERRRQRQSSSPQRIPVWAL